jgi:hypothetical protein
VRFVQLGLLHAPLPQSAAVPLAGGLPLPSLEDLVRRRRQAASSLHGGEEGEERVQDWLQQLHQVHSPPPHVTTAAMDDAVPTAPGTTTSLLVASVMEPEPAKPPIFSDVAMLFFAALVPYTVDYR